MRIFPRIPHPPAVKPLLTSMLLLSLLPPVWAADDLQYPEVKTASGFSRGVQKVIGFTALSGWIANRVIRKELGRHFDGNLDSDLRLYSGTDLLAGKARGFALEGHDLVYDGLVPISEFVLHSNQDMPLYVKKGRKPFLLRPTEFKLRAVLTEADLNRMLQSEKGRELLTRMKVDLPPFGEQYLDALEPAVDIQDGRLVIRTRVNVHKAPLQKALPVQVSGRIAAEKSELKLSDLAIDIEGFRNTEPVADFVEEFFGELVDLSKIKVDRHKLNIAFEKTELADDRLVLEATVTVKPEDKLIREFLSEAK